VLSGLCVANIREATFGYMDNIQVLGDDLQDIVRVDLACRDFEAASGALLNRNRKTTINGLGSWAGRQDWPLQWLLVLDHVKVPWVYYLPHLLPHDTALLGLCPLWYGENLWVLEDTEAGDPPTVGPGPGGFHPHQGLVYGPTYSPWPPKPPGLTWWPRPLAFAG
jgi:hypothetical protein